jgi:hypothetical protein
VYVASIGETVMVSGGWEWIELNYNNAHWWTLVLAVLKFRVPNEKITCFI